MTKKAGTVDATARITVLKPGAAICQPPGSSSLLTITALPACRANSSPGWRVSGAGWHRCGAPWCRRSSTMIAPRASTLRPPLPGIRTERKTVGGDTATGNASEFRAAPYIACKHWPGQQSESGLGRGLLAAAATDPLQGEWAEDRLRNSPLGHASLSAHRVPGGWLMWPADGDQPFGVVPTVYGRCVGSAVCCLRFASLQNGLPPAPARCFPSMRGIGATVTNHTTGLEAPAGSEE